MTMGDLTARCALCTHAAIKTRLFGGITVSCKKTGQKVGARDVCGNFAMDLNKKLVEIGFRDHVPGSGDCCLFCGHGRCGTGELAHVTSCDATGLVFKEGYQPGDHVCDYFKDFI